MQFHAILKMLLGSTMCISGFPVKRSLIANEGSNVTFLSDLNNRVAGKIDRSEWGVWINRTRWYPCIVATRIHPLQLFNENVCKPLLSRLKPPNKENLENGIAAVVLLNISLKDPRNFFSDIQLEGDPSEYRIEYAVKVSLLKPVIETTPPTKPIAGAGTKLLSAKFFIIGCLIGVWFSM